MSTTMAVTNNKRPMVKAWVRFDSMTSTYVVEYRDHTATWFDHGLTHLEAIFKAHTHCKDI